MTERDVQLLKPKIPNTLNKEKCRNKISNISKEIADKKIVALVKNDVNIHYLPCFTNEKQKYHHLNEFPRDETTFNFWKRKKFSIQ